MLALQIQTLDTRTMMIRLSRSNGSKWLSCSERSSSRESVRFVRPLHWNATFESPFELIVCFPLHYGRDNLAGSGKAGLLTKDN